MPFEHCSVFVPSAHEPSEHTAPAGQVMHVNSVSFVLYMFFSHTQACLLCCALCPLVLDPTGHGRHRSFWSAPVDSRYVSFGQASQPSGKNVISVVARRAWGALHTPLKQALLALWALFTDLRIMGKRFAAFRGVFYSEASRTDLEPVHSLLRAPYFTFVELNFVPSVDARSYGRGGATYSCQHLLSRSGWYVHYY